MLKKYTLILRELGLRELADLQLSRARARTRVPSCSPPAHHGEIGACQHIHGITDSPSQGLLAGQRAVHESPPFFQASNQSNSRNRFCKHDISIKNKLWQKTKC